MWDCQETVGRDLRRVLVGKARRLLTVWPEEVDRRAEDFMWISFF